MPLLRAVREVIPAQAQLGHGPQPHLAGTLLLGERWADGEVYGNVLDNAGQSGYIKESGQGGVVEWHDNQYLNGSSGPN